jgi:class 3 adenylate cyclase
MTRAGAVPPTIADLAEVLGMMAVKVEAREFQLEESIDELRRKNEELSTALHSLSVMEKIKSHLSRFVPQTVRDRVEANPEAPDLEKCERDVTILFLDIAGYTALSQNHDANAINQLVEIYFSSFLEHIYEHGGDINETAGDGLMLIFQHEDQNRHARNAVETALAIQSKVLAINAKHGAQFEGVSINIGINSGPALVGSTRLESLAGNRWTYTASGMVTNIAARAGKVATNGKILITNETANRVRTWFELDCHGHHEMKNVVDATELWCVTGRK